MMLSIREDPALFEMSLAEQVEALILQPLRDAAVSQVFASGLPLVIAVDGVDECGGGQSADTDGQSSREKDQIEVLSVILQAIQEPTFPCRIIVASRPERWIRQFLDENGVVRVKEIFLGDNYSPDQDIALFLKSKFAELSRRHGYNVSTWPKEQDMQKLVADASGQFIYAATIIRFIDSAWPLPKHQLDIVLKVRPPAGSSPFHILDALYTAILNSSPSPTDSVLWIKGVHRLTKRPLSLKISAWTIDRLFESSEGQAQTVLRLPSLVYLALAEPKGPFESCDFSVYAEDNLMDGAPSHPHDWNSFYSFYHKSFLDFLEDPERGGAAFPDVDDAKVERWIVERICKVLECE